MFPLLAYSTGLFLPVSFPLLQYGGPGTHGAMVTQLEEHPQLVTTVGGSGSLRRDSPFQVAPLPSDSFPHYSREEQGRMPLFCSSSP